MKVAVQDAKRRTVLKEEFVFGFDDTQVARKV